MTRHFGLPNPEAPTDGFHDWRDDPPPQQPKWWWWVAVGLLIGLAFILLLEAANARDLGQWKNVDPAITVFFSKLMQPDTIGMGGGVSCCGESDAYYADEVHVRDGHVFAVITDDRDDGPLMRIHEEIGTEYEVPPNKVVGMEQRLGNPTGHTIVFLGTAYWTGETRGKRPVLCYVQNGGV